MSVEVVTLNTKTEKMYDKNNIVSLHKCHVTVEGDTVRVIVESGNIPGEYIFPKTEVKRMFESLYEG